MLDARVQLLVKMLLDAGVRQGAVSVHETTLRWIDRFADYLPDQIGTGSNSAFVIQYSSEDKTRSVIFTFRSSLASTGVVSVIAGEDREPQKFSMGRVEGDFKWLYEYQRRTNKFKEQVLALELLFPGPYKAIRFIPPGDVEHYDLDLEPKKTLRAVYDDFAKKVTPKPCTLQIQTTGTKNIEIRTPVLEKAFYYGDPREQSFVKRVKDRFSRRNKAQ